MEEITVTELRSRLYQVVDEVLRTGEPQVIVRGGAKLNLSPVRARGKKKNVEKHPFEQYHGIWDKLEAMGKRKRPAILCGDEELIYGKSEQWNELKNL